MAHRGSQTATTVPRTVGFRAPPGRITLDRGRSLSLSRPVLKASRNSAYWSASRIRIGDSPIPRSPSPSSAPRPLRWPLDDGIDEDVPMHATDYVCALRRADEAYRVTPAEPPLSPVPIRRSDYPRAWGSHSLPLRYLFRKASEIARFHHVTALDRLCSSPCRQVSRTARS